MRERALSDCVVVVTPRSFGMHDPGLRRRLEAEVGVVRYCPGPLAAAALAQAVRDADGLLCGLDQVSAEVFDECASVAGRGPLRSRRGPGRSASGGSSRGDGDDHTGRERQRGG